ncbi:Hpt domain-containing protein [Hyphomicrobium sp. LHD-15]|uniref:Hpt domain-containing protein n=1 Tax=Hyphomicrobium sp. LHD-15 TaxID=3072142 RepID=UPI00280EAA54|nr:Hpt domain-containing protein [Hyphomicrobium sp. LHD-15]MDQ8700384.1 Hpt domain-containing protein [Hyphomicrobium sp. LHD-15]
MSTPRQSTLRRRINAVMAPEAPVSIVPSTDPIDRTHLARYTLGSPTLEREILGLFMAQLPLSIEQLRFAATDREWQIAAHTIKGSARAVGARHVARLALEAEQTSGVVDDEQDRERILTLLEEACEEVEGYVEGAFPSHETPRA